MATTDPAFVDGCASAGPACGCAARARPASLGAGVRTAARHLPLLPALALVLLPKCPLCAAAYLGILGSLGASSWVQGAWGLPLGAGLLAMTLGALALRARRTGDYCPPLLGLAGAAALLGGKFVLDAAPLLYAGAAALAAASIWSVRPYIPWKGASAVM
jgi:hypothetical protein